MAQIPKSSSAGSIDDLLTSLATRIPYSQFPGLNFARHDDEMTAHLYFRQRPIGNPNRPSLHRGATAAFLEITAATEPARRTRLVRGEVRYASCRNRLPKTAAFSIDYLRAGQPESAFAHAVIIRSERSFAWLCKRSRLFDRATGDFQLPGAHE